jgi:hypothetical protein
LTDGALFIVVWNASLSEEFSKVEYWLQSILHKAPHSSVIIVGTHADEVSKQGLGNVVTNALHKYQSLYSNVVAVVGVSCIRGGLGVDKLWQAIELVLQEEPSSIGELIPTRYNQLEQLLKVEAKNRSPPTISWKVQDHFPPSLSLFSSPSFSNLLSD